MTDLAADATHVPGKMGGTSHKADQMQDHAPHGIFCKHCHTRKYEPPAAFFQENGRQQGCESWVGLRRELIFRSESLAPAHIRIEPTCDRARPGSDHFLFKPSDF